MSGICGKFNYKTYKNIDKGLIMSMSESIKHRGPYAQYIHVNGILGLAVQSSSDRQQLSYNENRDIVAVTDGVIFNKPELTAFLGNKGNLNSVSGIFVNLYELLGKDFIQKIDGEFAFCIWDEQKKTLILGRNHFGNRPLYYYEGRDGLVFGSEIKAIVTDSAVERKVDCEALDAYFTFSYVPTPHTLFEGIKQIPAGSLLICEGNRINFVNYWEYSLKNISSKIKEKDCSEALYELLEKAVKKRINCVNTERVGAFLSSGIDTSIVVYLTKKLLNKRFDVFTVGFNDKAFNEIPAAKKTANYYDVNIHEIIVDEKMCIDALPKVILHTDFPFWDISAIPTYYAGMVACTNVDAVITGDGPDQLLAGSTKYAEWKKVSTFSNEFLRTKVLANFVNISRNFSTNNILFEKLLRNARIEALPLQERYFIRKSLLSPAQKHEAYNDDFSKQISHRIISEVIDKYFVKTDGSNFIDKLLYQDISLFLQDDLLVKVDRMLSAHSLQFLTPFLDKEVMNFVSTIPVHYKIKGLINPNKKYILKKAFSRYLPKEVIGRKKMGFSPPQIKWMRNNLKDSIIDNLLVNNSGISRYFNVEFVSKKVYQFYNNEYTNNCWLIWAFYMFELWHKAYIENQSIYNLRN